MEDFYDAEVVEMNKCTHFKPVFGGREILAIILSLRWEHWDLHVHVQHLKLGPQR